MSLLIGVDLSALEPSVAQVFEHLIAAVQTWSASPFGLALPAMRAYTVADQAITSGTDPATMIWVTTAEVGGTDPNFGKNTGIQLDTGSGRVTLTPGRYLLITSIVWEANATGYRYAGIFEHYDAGHEISLVQVPASSAGNQLVQQCAVVVDVATTAQYDVGVFQSSGGPLNVLADYHNTWFQVTKIG